MRRLLRFVILPVAALVAGTASARAQAAPGQAAAAAPSRIDWQVRNTTRLEVWRFFEPPPGGGDPDYQFAANRLWLAAGQSRPRVEWRAAVQYVQFGGLPVAASGPGPLGTGALYFDHAGRTDSRQVYLKALHVAFRAPAHGLRVLAGRFGYTSGAESPSGDVGVEAVKRQRIDARMIGEFDWSLYQRAFDGARVDVGRARWHVSAAALRPTQGGFEPRAGRAIEDLWIAAVSASVKPGAGFRHTDGQVFLSRYDDRRAVRARPDNTFQPAPRVDVGITTVGGHLAGAYPSARGRTDVVLWTAWQRGDWYGQTHEAHAVALEAGHQWTTARWRPWLRGGVFRASGDEDPADDRHGTFFPMVPTGRKYALSATYAQMNLTEAFAQAMLRPHADLGVRIEVHRLRLTEATDLWYAGSGATRATGTIFGFAGRRSGGSAELGWMVEGSADWTVTRHLSLNGYAGRLRGGRVVQALFKGRRLLFGYIESVMAF